MSYHNELIVNKEDLLSQLAKIPNARRSHGEASFGYSFELKDGSTLTIGQTDDDVSDPHILWIKHYKSEPFNFPK